MKKVLFATTALVATTGMAAAEVSFGGFGRFGLVYDEGNDATAGNDDVRIEQRFRLTATGTTTSDNGLEFEGRIRFQTDDNANGSSNVANNSAAGFAVSTGGFRLDVGHVSDVLDSGDVVDYYGYGVGLTSSIEQSSGFGLPASGFGTGSDDIAPTVKLRYTVGDFTVSASITDDARVGGVPADAADNGTLDAQLVAAGAAQGDDIEREEYQIGFGYNFGNYSVGVAFGNEDADAFTTETDTSTASIDNDFYALSFGGEIGALAFSILIADYDANDDTSYGFSVKYDVGAATEIRFAFADTGVDDEDEVYGIGFQHSLGGGVSLRGGVGQLQDGDTFADLGVVFNF
ncbi:porin [uncultured Tateyamaria sp.]|uniref:porin n=1 Tax=uncultured Tateyamaria sp. TaxID=455651 RepID=UPI002620EC12|nr:porin [uncultured Tateyamaria sp.]